MPAGRASPFWIDATAREFGPGERDALAEALDDVSAHTLVEELADASSVRLDNDGRMADGSRYTAAALAQLMKLTCRGGWSVVRELCSPGEGGVEPAPRLAINLFNRLAELRADRLVGRVRLVRDLRGTVDGILGPGYAFYENCELLEQAADTLDATGMTELAHAHWRNRKLVARFVRSGPDLRIRGGALAGGWHEGLHLANSEAGDASATIAPVIIHTATGGVALGRSHGRVVHIGRRFPQKLRRVLAIAASGRTAMRKLAARIEELDGLNAWPGGAGDDEAAMKVRKDAATAWRARGLSINQGRAIAACAAKLAARYPLDGSDGVSGACIARAALEIAAAESWSRREPVERLARGILFGDIALGVS